MISIPGYELTQEIHRGEKTIVYRGYREHDRCPMVFKTTRAPFPEPKDLARLQHEYALTKDWQAGGLEGGLEGGLIHAYELIPCQNTQVLILQDIGGTDLTCLPTGQALPLASFLTLALAFAKSLNRIHQHNIIHKDINPANLVVNQATGEAQIIDFGISSQLSRETQELESPSHLEGTLAYLSPEQTGRMNRVLDYRTDFYSLGATFYKMLTGVPPFTATDPMELVHCHLARTPIPPQELRPELPPVLSGLVQKLMEKAAENRYQSAVGLIADLETCIQQLINTQDLMAFPLGRKDISERFQIPQKLYGRESEVQQVLDAFARVSRGQTNMLLVAGYSGVGKTAVVQEVYKPITEKNGYFIAGKFDQFQRDIPYASLIDAFQELMRQLLTESTARIDAWKIKLETALGANAQVIIEVIPDLALIIGPRPVAPALPPQEARNRFQATFRLFIEIFAQPEHPLVLFLDDLQWADSASLSFIEELLQKSRELCLLILGAYRDNEVHAAHPLMLTLETLRGAQARFSTLCLQPLSFPDLKQWVTDTLTPAPKSSTPLAELIASKTGGNPFFVSAFLTALYEDGCLTFNTAASGWQWEMAQIEARQITDNVVELMSRKLRTLPPGSQELLVRAACIGHQFDLATLTLISGGAPALAIRDLWEAVKAGLVQQQGMFRIEEVFLGFSNSGTPAKMASYRFRFIHDRVQQAAYELLPAADTAVLHLKIGRLWLRQTNLAQNDEFLFAVVNQFYAAKDLVQEKTERIALAQLNLQAGKKAISSTAFTSALHYLDNGLALLAGGDWEHEYALTLDLSLTLAQCEYLNHRHEAAIQYFKTCLQHVKTAVEKAMIHLKQVELFSNNDQYAINEGLAGLSCLGISLSQRPRQFHLLLELVKERWHRKGRAIKPLLDQLPLTEKPEHQLTIRLFSAIAPFAYWTNPLLSVISITKAMNFVYRHGITPDTAYILMCFANTSIALERYPQAWNLAQKGLELAQYESPGNRSMSTFVFANLINHWYKPLHSGLPYFDQNLKLTLESGNWIYATMSMSNQIHILYGVGTELTVLKEQSLKFLQLTVQMNDPLKCTFLFKFFAAVADSLISTDAESSFSQNLSATAAQAIENISNLSTNYLICIFSSWHELFFTNFQEAAAQLKKAGKSLSGARGTHLFTDYYYLSILITLGMETEFPVRDKKQRKCLQAHLQKLQAWAKQCPQNFEHKYLLAAAEMARAEGNHETAASFYDQAIDAALRNGFIHHQALGCEYAARFYLQCGKNDIAKPYLKKAYYLFAKWGAHAKVSHLEKKYPSLLTSPEQQAGPLATAGAAAITSAAFASIQNTGRFNSESLDLAAIMKATQAISGEIVLGHLLEKLMRIVIENAGAQHGFLLLETDGQWRIEAEGNVNTEMNAAPAAVSVLQSHPLADEAGNSSPFLPVSLIQYVGMKKEAVMLDNACAKGRFIHDPYISQHQAKSLLCAPIIHQGKLAGILYLENRLIEGAFTADRLKILEILSSQAAISIQNARVYENLETTVAQRTADLKASNCSLESTLQDLRATQTKLIQAEKRIALGQLVANVAHEINSPISACKSNGEIIATLINDVITDLPKLFSLLESRPRGLFGELIQPTNKEKTSLSTREARTLKNRVAQELQENNVAGADEKAQILVKLGVHATARNYLPLLTHPDANFIMSTANSIATILDSTNAINTAVDRVSRIVTTLKAFSEADSTGEMAHADLKDGIESALLFYQNDIKNGTKLIRQYEDFPLVRCFHDELKQVWTHIIHNALQAMNYNGTLTIGVRTCGRNAEVSITDTGSGIPNEICTRIFDPFFTTRAPGEGAGLGLGIVKKIVDKHQGRLDVQTEIGVGSTFIVVIPLEISN